MTDSLNDSIQTQFRTIDGVSIRFAESEDRDQHALLLSPWPESLFAFAPMWTRLAERTHLVAIDLPGFGHSERREALLSPRAMGDFVVRGADPRQIVAGVLTTRIERYTLPDAVREDYLSSYEGDRFVESMRYVRAYPRELPILRDLLPGLQTPVQLIAGRRDPIVPPVNAEFLHERLPKSKLDILETGHFTWEDSADEYAALVTSWWGGGYATAGAAATP